MSATLTMPYISNYIERRPMSLTANALGTKTANKENGDVSGCGVGKTITESKESLDYFGEMKTMTRTKETPE